MVKKFIKIYHNNVATSINNSIFDVHKKTTTEASIYAKLKSLLERKNININTYDIPTKISSYKNIHIDIPYPSPSSMHIWKEIVLSRKKNILLCMEPPVVNPFSYMKIFHHFFTKVYTWNDDLVDSRKYFKLKILRVSQGIHSKSKKFKNKKFLILINSNKFAFTPFRLLSTFGKELYSERIKAIEFFERKIPDKFSLYGWGWNKPKKYSLSERLFGYKKYSSYKGEIEDKIKLLSEFKFCICFENLTNTRGLVTEKIFDCFKAKCVPVYWGASNIEKLIPKECFIDFRDFKNYEVLLNFLDSIDETTYNNYIKNIKRLLIDKKFIENWFEDGFTKFFLEDVLEIQE